MKLHIPRLMTKQYVLFTGGNILGEISFYPMLGFIFYGNHLNGLHKTSRLIANAKQILNDGPLNRKLYSQVHNFSGRIKYTLN